MFQFNATLIPGCFHIQSKVLADDRGYFIKSFQNSAFLNSPIRQDINFVEHYYSLSKKNVIRGMHLQVGEDAHDKLVNVARGKVMDVVLDVRKDSPMYGKYIQFILSEGSGDALFIPKGCAHGFLSLADDTMTVYRQTTEYAPKNDKGILWNSFGLDWGVLNPIISKRDLEFPALGNF